MMQIQESPTPGKILVDCPVCGKFYEENDFRKDPFAEAVRICLESSRICPDCRNAEAKAKEELAAAAISERRREQMPDLCEAAGLPRNYTHHRETGELFTVPLIREVAEFLWRNRSFNILLSGATGTGKSTSAAFVGMQLIAQGRSICYTSLGNLLAKWREARKNDKKNTDTQLLHEIFYGPQIFIIDEVVGKAKVSESGQELLFDILEAVNSGECRSKIWLLGNFYQGSIESIFADPEPVRRRLQENFLCMRITESGTLERLTVWGGQ